MLISLPFLRFGEIFWYYHIHLYCMSALSLHRESTDSMITSGNRTPGSTDLVDTLADSVCIHWLVLKPRSKAACVYSRRPDSHMVRRVWSNSHHRLVSNMPGISRRVKWIQQMWHLHEVALQYTSMRAWCMVTTHFQLCSHPLTNCSTADRATRKQYGNWTRLSSLCESLACKTSLASFPGSPPHDDDEQ